MNKVLAFAARDCGFDSRHGDAGSNPVTAKTFFFRSTRTICNKQCTYFHGLDLLIGRAPYALGARDEDAGSNPVAAKTLFSINKNHEGYWRWKRGLEDCQRGLILLFHDVIWITEIHKIRPSKDSCWCKRFLAATGFEPASPSLAPNAWCSTNELHGRQINATKSRSWK